MAVVPRIVNSEATSYYIVLGLMLIQGCGIAFLQSALYGVAGISMKLTNMLMIGIALGSVLMNLIRIVLLATVTD